MQRIGRYTTARSGLDFTNTSSVSAAAEQSALVGRNGQHWTPSTRQHWTPTRQCTDCHSAIKMHSQHACIVLLSLLQRTCSLRPVRAISLDITGTLITHKGSVVQHYVDAAVWAQLENPPSVDEMKPAFKKAYNCLLYTSPSPRD